MRFTVLGLLVIMSLSTQASATVRIAAAADLQPALTVIEQQFKQMNPSADIAITYGASGVLTSQLRQGAPFQLFISANQEYSEILIKEGLAQAPGTNYADGRIAFITHANLEAKTAIDALHQWQKLKKSTDRLAIANPRHAPNGVTAMSWLEHWHMDEPIEKDLVFGENASQSVQFVLSEAANSGIVAWPLIAKRDKTSITSWLIPEDEHSPSPRNMVLMRQATETAQLFYQFMLSDTAINTLIEYGFGVP